MKMFNLLIMLLLGLSIISLTSCDEENDNIIDAYAAPNPFSPTKDITIQSQSGGEPLVIKEFTNIILSFKNTGNYTTLKFTVYDLQNDEVWNYSKGNTYSGNTVTESTVWGGQNDLGEIVNPGLYSCEIKIESGITATKRVDIWVK